MTYPEFADIPALSAALDAAGYLPDEGVATAAYLAIGMRRPGPNALCVTIKPGGICLRLCSLMRTRRHTRFTIASIASVFFQSRLRGHNI